MHLSDVKRFQQSAYKNYGNVCSRNEFYSTGKPTTNVVSDNNGTLNLKFQHCQPCHQHIQNEIPNRYSTYSKKDPRKRDIIKKKIQNLNPDKHSQYFKVDPRKSCAAKEKVQKLKSTTPNNSLLHPFTEFKLIRVDIIPRIPVGKMRGSITFTKSVQKNPKPVFFKNNDKPPYAIPLQSPRKMVCDPSEVSFESYYQQRSTGNQWMQSKDVGFEQNKNTETDEVKSRQKFLPKMISHQDIQKCTYGQKSPKVHFSSTEVALSTGVHANCNIPIPKLTAENQKYSYRPQTDNASCQFNKIYNQCKQTRSSSLMHSPIPEKSSILCQSVVQVSGSGRENLRPVTNISEESTLPVPEVQSAVSEVHSPVAITTDDRNFQRAHSDVSKCLLKWKQTTVPKSVSQYACVHKQKPAILPESISQHLKNQELTTVPESLSQNVEKQKPSTQSFTQTASTDITQTVEKPVIQTSVSETQQLRQICGHPIVTPKISVQSCDLNTRGKMQADKPNPSVQTIHPVMKSILPECFVPITRVKTPPSVPKHTLDTASQRTQQTTPEYFEKTNEVKSQLCFPNPNEEKNDPKAQKIASNSTSKTLGSKCTVPLHVIQTNRFETHLTVKPEITAVPKIELQMSKFGPKIGSVHMISKKAMTQAVSKPINTNCKRVEPFVPKPILKTNTPITDMIVPKCANKVAGRKRKSMTLKPSLQTTRPKAQSSISTHVQTSTPATSYSLKGSTVRKQPLVLNSVQTSSLAVQTISEMSRCLPMQPPPPPPHFLIQKMFPPPCINMTDNMYTVQESVKEKDVTSSSSTETQNTLTGAYSLSSILNHPSAPRISIPTTTTFVHQSSGLKMYPYGRKSFLNRWLSLPSLTNDFPPTSKQDSKLYTDFSLNDSTTQKKHDSKSLMTDQRKESYLRNMNKNGSVNQQDLLYKSPLNNYFENTGIKYGKRSLNSHEYQDESYIIPAKHLQKVEDLLEKRVYEPLRNYQSGDIVKPLAPKNSKQVDIKSTTGNLKRNKDEQEVIYMKDGHGESLCIKKSRADLAIKDDTLPCLRRDESSKSVEELKGQFAEQLQNVKTLQALGSIEEYESDLHPGCILPDKGMTPLVNCKGETDDQIKEECPSPVKKRKTTDKSFLDCLYEMEVCYRCEVPRQCDDDQQCDDTPDKGSSIKTEKTDEELKQLCKVGMSDVTGGCSVQMQIATDDNTGKKEQKRGELGRSYNEFESKFSPQIVNVYSLKKVSKQSKKTSNTNTVTESLKDNSNIELSVTSSKTDPLSLKQKKKVGTMKKHMSLQEEQLLNKSLNKTDKLKTYLGTNSPKRAGENELKAYIPKKVGKKVSKANSSKKTGKNAKQNSVSRS